MRWAIDDEQQMLVEALSGWLDSVADPAVVRAWLTDADRTTFEGMLVEAGWLGIGVSEHDGGQGGGLLELALVAEQFARRAVPSSTWLASVVALPALAGQPQLAGLVDDGEFVALAVSANAPIDGRRALSGATVTSDASGRLSGTVDSVLGADSARWFIVPVMSEAGLRLHLVDATSDGISLESLPILDLSRTASTVTLSAAPSSVLDVDARAILTEASHRAAVLIAADSLGAATRMLELAVEYSRQRTQYGAVIGSFQAMKHAAATMLVEQEASRSIVYYAAATVDEHHEEAGLHAATAKAQVVAAGARTADGALAMHGAIGYTWEHDLQFLYKRAMFDVALHGAPTVWNERIATALDLVPGGSLLWSVH